MYDDKRDRAVTYVLCRDPHLKFLNAFWSLQKERKVKFGVKLFQAKLLSRLSHKACRLLSSPVVAYFHNIQLFRERLSEKLCTGQSRKVIWDMINALFLTLPVESTFVAFF